MCDGFSPLGLSGREEKKRKVCNTATLKHSWSFACEVKQSPPTTELTATAAQYVGVNRSGKHQQGGRMASRWARPSSIWMPRGQFPVVFIPLRLFTAAAPALSCECVRPWPLTSLEGEQRSKRQTENFIIGLNDVTCPQRLIEIQNYRVGWSHKLTGFF